MERRTRQYEVDLQAPPLPGVKRLVVKLPGWKAYLYDLIERIKYYQWINAGLMNFKLSRHQGPLIGRMLSKYGLEDVKLRPRAHRYNAVVNAVYRNLAWATPQEIAIADKLFPVTYLNVEDLVMEIAQLRKFADEVGIPATAYRTMKEKDLIKAIIGKVDPAASYSPDFVGWYSGLPDDLFNEVESTAGADDGKVAAGAAPADQTTNTSAEATNGSDEFPLEEVLALVEDPDTSQTDLIDTCNMVPVFKGLNPASFTDAESLRQAMLKVLTGGTGDEPPATDASAEAGITIDEVIEAINDPSTKDLDALMGVIDSVPNMFNGFSAPKLFAVAKKKAIAHLESLKAAQASAPATQAASTTGGEQGTLPFDVATLDVEVEYAKVEKMEINPLRKYASALGIASKGAKKADLLDAIAGKLQEYADQAAGGGEASAEGDGEAEITADLINSAVQAKDNDTLNKIAEALAVTFNALEKRDPARMGNKLLKALEIAQAAEGASSGEAAAPAANAPAASGSDSVYAKIEAMVLAGQSVDAITEAVTPAYTAMGKPKVYITKRVATLVEIIMIDHGMKK